MKTALPGWFIIFLLISYFSFSQSSVVSFTLVNAETNTDIKILENNSTINLAGIGSAINIRANTQPAIVGSILFTKNGKRERLENVFPYALAGDFPTGNYNHYIPDPGTSIICATPYSKTNGKGRKGKEFCITLTFINGTSPLIEDPNYNELDFWGEKIAIQIKASDPNGGPLKYSAVDLPPSLSIDPNTGLVSGVLDLENDFGSSTGFNAILTVTNANGSSASTTLDFFILHPNIDSFTLIDSNTDQPIEGFDPIVDDIIDLSVVGYNLNIRANPNIENINGGSILFTLNGDFIRAENVPPYALGGGN